MAKLSIFVLCCFVVLALVQGLPTGLEDQANNVQTPKKDVKHPSQFKSESSPEEEPLESADEDKDLSSSNTFGFGYYGYPRYYRSYYPSYYGGYPRYYGGYGGYYSPYRYYNHYW